MVSKKAYANRSSFFVNVSCSCRFFLFKRVSLCVTMMWLLSSFETLYNLESCSARFIRYIVSNVYYISLNPVLNIGDSIDINMFIG